MSFYGGSLPTNYRYKIPVVNKFKLFLACIQFLVSKLDMESCYLSRF